MRRLIIALLLVVPLLGNAQNPPESRAVDDALRTLGSVRNFYQVAMSPDGQRVAWVQNQGREGGRGTIIVVADLRSPGNTRTISANGDMDAFQNQIAWSPDSRRIAFLSDAARKGQQQLYTANESGGKVRKLTNLKGFLSAPAWSPDGNTIALLFIENSPRAAGPLQPMTPPEGVIEEHLYEQRLNLVGVDDGKLRAISPEDMYVYEYDWMPDSSGFVVSAARGSGDNNWWIAQLYRLPIDGKMQSVYKPRMQVANPRVSPDGKRVAFIEGLMSDQGVTGGDVHVLGLSEGIRTSERGEEPGARNLTPNLPASATWLEWSNPESVVFTELIDGNSGIASVDTRGNVRQLWSAPELITAGSWDVSMSVSANGKRSAVVRSTAERAPEVWAGDSGQWTQVTGENGGVKPVWGDLRSLHWQSDPFRVQGWLLFPRNYDASKRYALVVNVHGGPASACLPGWPNPAVAPLATLGYFVLCPNPRGSYGQGEKFVQANVKDFGGGDFRDIMAGVDQVLKELPVDSRRLGIQGWSYGGYMTMWAETQTNRFAAAIAGAGLSNWVSYYGQNDIDQWLIPYFGASVYDDPAVYAKSQPINFVKNVKTPTLILVGDRDGECPAPQSFEWWHALKDFGVPVQFVVYPNEGHQIGQAKHRRDVVLRTAMWFDKYLNAPAAAQKSAAAAK